MEVITIMCKSIGTVRNDYIFRNEAIFVDGCGRRFSNFFAYKITCKAYSQRLAYTQTLICMHIRHYECTHVHHILMSTSKRLG